MALTKNDPRKINLLPMMFLVCFINKGASNANSCPAKIVSIPFTATINYYKAIVTNCVARGFAHQLSL